MKKTLNDYINQLEKHAKANDIAFRWFDKNNNSIIVKTYEDFLLDIKRYANLVTKILKNPEGKHIALVSNNNYEYIVAYIGTILSKAVLVPINNRNEDSEIKYELEFSDIDLILADDKNIERVKNLSNIESIIKISSFNNYDSNFDYLEDNNTNRLAMLMYTSGTSGKSKCVMLSVKNILASTDCVKNWANNASIASGKEKKDHIFIMLPMFHVMTLAAITGYLNEGLVLELCVDFRSYFNELNMLKSNAMLTVPIITDSIYQSLLKNKNTSWFSSINTIVSGGAAADSKQVELFYENGILYQQGYGLTETFGGLTQNIYGLSKKYNSVGCLVTDLNEIKIIDSEICIKGENIMLGYYKNPKETIEVLYEEWFHTGDLGFIDDEGYLYITGRKKNLIILSNGENVSPEELEGNLLRNENIKEVVVKEINNEIGAEIYCESIYVDSIRSFITNVNSKLPYYKRITNLMFRDKPFERTTTGKIKRANEDN